ncbi:mCG145439, partial [Mus musculus]
NPLSPTKCQAILVIKDECYDSSWSHELACQGSELYSISQKFGGNKCGNLTLVPGARKVAGKQWLFSK